MKAFSPRNERIENENAMLDRDGFPPCTMTVDQLCEHLRDTFSHPDFRIVAFKVRGYAPGGTLTTRRGDMLGTRATKAQVHACKKDIEASKT